MQHARHELNPPDFQIDPAMLNPWIDPRHPEEEGIRFALRSGTLIGTARDVADLRKQIDALNQKADEIRKALTPEQQRDLKSAHTVVNRKQFSWSRLFADLEAALPRDVRVQRIAVKEVRTDGDRTVANLELVVASKSSTTVTEMIQNMEREGIFHAELTSQNPERGREESGAEYELNVYYSPRAGAPIPVADRNNRPVDTATEGARTR